MTDAEVNIKFPRDEPGKNIIYDIQFPREGYDISIVKDVKIYFGIVRQYSEAAIEEDCIHINGFVIAEKIINDLPVYKISPKGVVTLLYKGG